MKKNKEKKVRTASATAAILRIEHEAEAGALGAIGGAAAGAGAGLPGTIVGAVVGAIAGALTGAAVDSADRDRAARTRKLDAEIGVTEGNIGAPNLLHPPESRR
jgi:outer membrane lipoprotein SlyB